MIAWSLVDNADGCTGFLEFFPYAFSNTGSAAGDDYNFILSPLSFTTRSLNLEGI